MRKSFFAIGCVWFAVLLLAGCRPPAEQGKPVAAPRPNILFAIADDASYPHFGAYGTTWVQTPAFDRIAREGILFTNAYTPNAKCAPSRANILTGRNSWQLEEAANHVPFFPEKFTTYVEALSTQGYFTGFTGKGWAPGVAEKDGKPRLLTGPRFDSLKTQPPAQFISNNDYASNFEAFLDQLPDGQPFCFWYGGLEPHRAYEFGAGRRLAGKEPSDIEDVYPFWPDNDTVRTDLLDYAFEIEYFDSHLERMLRMLEDRGLMENTIIVVTADNGMPFPRIKGQEYELSNHLPLAIMWPSGIKNPGRTVTDYVSFIDFAPTFLEVAGIDALSAGMQPVTGNSLTDIFYSGDKGRVNPERNYVLIGKERHDVGRPQDQGYPIRGIVQEGFLYLHNFEPERWPAGNPETGYLNTDGSPTKTVILQMRKDPATRQYWTWSFGKRPQEELFNVQNDPACMNNLAESPAYAALKDKLKDRLFSALRDQQDPRMFGNGDIFDAYIYADETTRNFYERYLSGEPVKAGWVNLTDFEKEPIRDGD